MLQAVFHFAIVLVAGFTICYGLSFALALIILTIIDKIMFGKRK